MLILACGKREKKKKNLLMYLYNQLLALKEKDIR